MAQTTHSTTTQIGKLIAQCRGASLPVCSIIRPTNTKGAAAAAVRALTADGLFMDQKNEAFFDLLQDLATDADAATRGFQLDF